MPDREKVIKDLHDIAGFIAGRVGIEQARNFLRTIDDVIELLKEDCHNCKLECLLQKYDQLKEKYDSLLKDQEEVVHPEPSCEMTYITDCCCDLCGVQLIREDIFCRCCGKRIEWEGR